MKALLAIALAMFAISAQAQYRCTVNGQRVYSDQPCAVNAEHVGKMQDRVTADQQVQRLRQSIKERRQRNAIEARDDAEFAEQKARQAEQEAAQQQRAANANRDKKYRCDDLRRRITNNERAVARYRDFQWQQQLTQQENELRRNREAYEDAGCN